MVCMLAGCSIYNVREVELDMSDSKYESNTPVPTNPATTTEQQETSEQKSAFDKLSSEEKRNLNVFFSNFAEAYLDEYNRDAFSANDLIEFAFIHNRVNDTSEEEFDMFDSEYFDEVMGFKVQVMDMIIDRYFGVKVPHEDTVYINEYGSYSGYAFKNGYVYTGAATGGYYDFCAVVTSLVDLGDGTYRAEYDKYGAELDMMDKKYYSYTAEQAQSDPELEYRCSYTAVIKPAVVDGKKTWQLLKLMEM